FLRKIASSNDFWSIISLAALASSPFARAQSTFTWFDKSLVQFLSLYTDHLIDGGGVRGLSELIILDELMNRLSEKAQIGDGKLLPYQVFDVICGTSTGGLIALMLGRLQMKVEQCLDAYVTISKKVFGRPRSFSLVRRHMFSAERLKEAIEDTLGTQGLMREERMFDDRQDACKVFVCATPSASLDTRRLRTYSAGGQRDNYKIWEAARATTAAPKAFERITIVGRGNVRETFIDGGWGCQNPSRQMVRELQDHFDSKSKGIDCIVSLGTGSKPRSDIPRPAFWQGALPSYLVRSLVEIITNAHEVHTGMQHDFDPKTYFRFDVAQGMDQIAFGEWEMLERVRGLTVSYLQDRDVSRRLDEVVAILAQKVGSEISPGRAAAASHNADAELPNFLEEITSNVGQQNENIENIASSRVIAGGQREGPQQYGPVPRIVHAIPNALSSNLETEARDRVNLLQFSAESDNSRTALQMSRWLRQQAERERKSQLEAGFLQSIRPIRLFSFDERISQATETATIAASNASKTLGADFVPAIATEPRPPTGNAQTVDLTAIAEIYPDEAEENSSSERAEGTCDWIFRQDEFEKWKSKESAHVLMVVGLVGQGKSVLARYVASSIRNTGPKALVLTFACSTLESQNTPLVITQSLLYQALDLRKQLFKGIDPALLESVSSDKGLSFQSLWGAFAALFTDRKAPETYCIIDGIDQCTRSAQKEILKAVYRDVGDKLWVMITSRDTAITDEFRPKALGFKIDTVKTKGDIVQYINVELRKLRDVGSDDLVEFIKVISEEASDDGMFLWVSLVIQELMRPNAHLTRTDILSSWLGVPKHLKLYRLYARELGRIPQERQAEAHRIFQLLIFSLTNFRIAEFRIAISDWYESCASHSDLMLNQHILAARDAKNTCGTLIKITGDAIRITHPSAVHYLLDSSDKHGKLITYFFNYELAHMDLARHCISYLLLGDIVIPMEVTTLDLEKYPFLGYALDFWFLHLRYANGASRGITHLLRRFFGQSEHRFRRCLGRAEFINLRYPKERKWGDILILHSLIFGGCSYLLENSYVEDRQSQTQALGEQLRDPILRLEAAINSKNALDETPLHLAASIKGSESEKMLTYLLAHGADPSLRDFSGSTALHAAADLGSAETVRLLLERDKSLSNLESSSGYTALDLAADAGELPKVDLLIFAGATIDHKGTGKSTALHFAAGRGHKGVVLRLLLAGAGINSRGKGHWTPLHYAAEAGHVDVAEALLDKGANLNCKTIDDITPLHFASLNGHLGMTKALVERDPELEAISLSTKETPLHFAASNGHTTVVDVLVKAGANRCSQDMNGHTPFFAAARIGSVNCAKLLMVDDNDVRRITPLGSTALSEASITGHLNMVSWLIENRADARFISNQRIPMLHTVIAAGHEDIARILVEHGADIESQWNEVSRPLHVAAQRDHPKLASYLLDKGANPSWKSDTGHSAIFWFSYHGRAELVKRCLEIDQTLLESMGHEALLLHAAAREGHQDIIDLILQKGGQVNCGDNQHITPLHLAALNGHLETTKKLLEMGAFAECKSIHGLSPMHMAAQNGHVDVLRLLKGAGASMECQTHDAVQPIHLAAQNNNSAVIEELLLGQVDADCETTKKDTPLHFAASAGHSDIIRRLVSEGVRVDVRNTNGITPLSCYCWTSCNLETIKELLDKGANPNNQDENMYTPFHDVAFYGRPELIEAFLEHVEYVEVINKYGFSPLHLAAGLYHMDCVRLLESRGGDISSYDFYGRSAYFWARMCEPSIFQNRPDFAPPVELADTEWKEHLSQAVKRISKTLLENLKNGLRYGPFYHKLGKCLAFMGQDNYAIISFERNIEGRDSLKHHSVCDMCRMDEGIIGLRWACTECQDFDLCDKHYKEYEKNSLRLGGCFKHKYLKVPREIYSSLDPGIVGEDGLTVQAWLTSLAETGAATSTPDLGQTLSDERNP
ncbi:hypothetical protein GP486_005821, partial [Trichoglossum hirsutum]